MGLTVYVLKREDDNGNVFVVDTFEDRAAAEAALAQFEHHLYHHKQNYFIEEKN